MYFELLEIENAKALPDKKRTIEELLLKVLSAYLPQPWHHTASGKK